MGSHPSHIIVAWKLFGVLEKQMNDIVVYERAKKEKNLNTLETSPNEPRNAGEAASCNKLHESWSTTKRNVKMDASTSSYEDEETHTTKSIQAAVGNFGAVRDAWGSHAPFHYPDTRRDEDVSDDYLGTKISDPYRWLENPHSEETQTFIEEQNALTDAYLEKSNWRDAIRAKLTELWDYKKTQCPKKFGSRYFYMENSGLQNQAILYVKESLDGEPRVLMEPNELSMDGAAAISDYEVSPNGEYIAYALSDFGSDWSSIYIKNVSSGHNYLEVLNFTKLLTISWTSDSRGFFYQRFPKTKTSKVSGTDSNVNQKQKLYYHRIGTRQDDDVMIVEFPDNPTWIMFCDVSLDGRYLVVYAGDVVAESHTFYMDIGKSGAITRDNPIVNLFPEPGRHVFLGNDDNLFYFRTNFEAPNFKIISFDVEKNEWSNMIEENPSAVIVWAKIVAGDKLVLCYNEHLDTRLEIHKLDDSGELIKTIAFEDNISPYDHYGRRDLPDLFLRVESYLNPGILYRLYFEDDSVESEVYDKIEIPYYDPTSFTSELVFYSNDDGTNIPMTLVYKNTTELDGSAPCILYGYGGFGKTSLPYFDVPYILFAQNFDGVVAVANIRGGGEYGQTWWEEGRGLTKPNTVEDFVAAANFLVNNKYTRASKLTAMGASNGGMVVAAAINKRPDLFGGVIADVGVMDLLRFRNFTIGFLWIREYGDVEKEDELHNILRYSPLHNITPPSSNSSPYPAVFVTTADHDDRVVPFHSYKYTAELQHSVGQTMTQTNPLMMRVYQNIGHGFRMPTMKAIEKATDMFCFLENALGYEFHF